jgi:hypothetical protein
VSAGRPRGCVGGLEGIMNGGAVTGFLPNFGGFPSLRGLPSSSVQPRRTPRRPERAPGHRSEETTSGGVRPDPGPAPRPRVPPLPPFRMRFPLPELSCPVSAASPASAPAAAGRPATTGVSAAAGVPAVVAAATGVRSAAVSPGPPAAAGRAGPAAAAVGPHTPAPPLLWARIRRRVEPFRNTVATTPTRHRTRNTTRMKPKTMAHPPSVTPSKRPPVGASPVA